MQPASTHLPGVVGIHPNDEAETIEQRGQHSTVHLAQLGQRQRLCQEESLLPLIFSGWEVRVADTIQLQLHRDQLLTG